jgi:hypothetical protein
MSTIFDNIVTKENDHTQLLRNIMERDPKAAAVIMSYLIGRDVSEVEAASLEFRTQCLFLGVNGREIPDILVEGSGFRCLIEAKVDPTLELTDRQKAGYQACLEGDGERHLAFLVPNDWRHRAGAEQVQSLVPASVRVHTSNWQELIEKLDIISVPLADAVLIEVIRFWKWRFQLVQMTTQERESLEFWSAERYSAIRKLEKTISLARALFDARDNYETELETSFTDSYGFYLKQAPKYLLWIGIWIPSQVPLSFGFHAKSRQWLRPANHPSAPISVQDHLMWPLGAETWDNPEMLYAKVKSFLDAYPTPSN